jgi:hypothetical protein
MSDMLPFQPSLASATNTRLDTAARHMQQCRVSTDDMMRFVNNDAEELQRSKYRYCVHKDELVIGVGRPWDMTVVKKPNNAYPRVVSNLGALDDDESTRSAIQMIRFMNHYARNVHERRLIVDLFRSEAFTQPRYRGGAGWINLDPTCQCFEPTAAGNKIRTKDFLSMMHDYYPVGYATTLGYAHPNTGDTMTSVLIGGLITVQNGDFEVFAGDPIQFYWCFEKDDFERDGRRRKYLDIWDNNIPQNVDPSVDVADHKKRTWQAREDSEIRRRTYDLSYGQFNSKKAKGKLVGKIKPYFPDEENPRLHDWYRVFGIAIASARPNEMVDIKISRQSM